MENVDWKYCIDVVVWTFHIKLVWYGSSAEDCISVGHRSSGRHTQVCRCQVMHCTWWICEKFAIYSHLFIQQLQTSNVFIYF